MDENIRTDYLRRMQDAMRPLTDTEIAEKQRSEALGMMNDPDPMRGGEGMQNFWCTDEEHWIPDKPKPTFWQRLKGLVR